MESRKQKDNGVTHDHHEDNDGNDDQSTECNSITTREAFRLICKFQDGVVLVVIQDAIEQPTTSGRVLGENVCELEPVSEILSNYTLQAWSAK
jgi:hypothetical protein